MTRAEATRAVKVANEALKQYRAGSPWQVLSEAQRIEAKDLEDNCQLLVEELRGLRMIGASGQACKCCNGSGIAP
jgi:hypothetical protein